MKYWIYINGEVPGSYEPSELACIQGFGAASMVCQAQGDIQGRHWQRAGLFPDIAAALEDRQRHPAAARQPVPGPQSPEKDVINAASRRLFQHVTELMKQLEGTREERGLIQSLQRTAADLKNELQASRERIQALEAQASLIPGFEDRENKLQEFLKLSRQELAQARKETQDGEAAVARMQRELDALRRESQQAAAAADKNAAELRRLTQLNEDANRQLAEKELSLAKSLGLLGRLEETLATIAHASGSKPPEQAPDRPAP